MEENNMSRKNQNDYLYVIPVIITVFIARCLNLTFYETFVSGLLVSLFMLLIVWTMRRIGKKKLCAVIRIDKPVNNKCKVSVLIWNPALLKSVYCSDYGEYGLCFNTDYDTVIEKFTLKTSNEFNFSVQPDTADNVLKLRMGDMKPKSFVEFKFAVSKKVKTDEYPRIFLPYGVKTINRFTGTLSVSLLYDHTNININILRYNSIYQAVNRICSIGVIATMVLFPAIISANMILKIDVSPDVNWRIAFFGLMAATIFFSVFVSFGDVIPPFIMKNFKFKEK
jgi:hypothetical protein